MTAADLTLFLDFDGVLHPLWEPASFNNWTSERIHGPKAYVGPFFIHAPILVDLLTGYLPHIDIVISSSWARRRDLDTLRNLLPAEIAGRVIDAVHHRLQVKPGTLSRWSEIAWYREQHPNIGDRWLAIDDDNNGWPAHAVVHLAYCNRDLGDPASQAAVKHVLFLRLAIHPFSADAAANLDGSAEGDLTHD